MQTSLARGQRVQRKRRQGCRRYGRKVPSTGLKTRHYGAASRAVRLPFALAVREQCYTFSFEQHIGGASVPLYEYKCLKCGRKTEKIENVSGPHLKKCPHCGGKVESVITAPAIQFKGAGWYVTDYAGKKAVADGDKADKPATETKETASKEKDSASKEGASKESSSKEEKDKKPAKKK
jgi:putative FmdB family regulatory protein